MLPCKRATGRTTRMLQRAKQLEEQGRAVYIVCANQSEKLRLERELVDYPSIKLETFDSLGPHLDLETLRLRRGHPNCVVLVDHHAIESRFAALLEELGRYDEEPT